MFDEFLKKSKKGIALLIGSVADATASQPQDDDPDFLRVLLEFNSIEKDANELVQNINKNLSFFHSTLTTYRVALDKVIEPFSSEYHLLFDKSQALYSSSSSIISICEIYCSQTGKKVVLQELSRLFDMINFGKIIKDKRRKYQVLMKQQEIEMKHKDLDSTEEYRKYIRKFDQFTREFTSTVNDINKHKKLIYAKTMNAYVFTLKQLINDCNNCIDNRVPKPSN